MEEQLYDIKDLVTAGITKSSVQQDCGLHLQEQQDGGIFVAKVESFFKKFTPVEPGDRLIKFQEKYVTDYEGGLNEIEQIMKDEMTLVVQVVHSNNNDSFQSNTSLIEE